MSTFSLFLLYVFYGVAFATYIGQSVLMTDAAQKNGAVCLDGTPGNYYFAAGEESRKYVLFFQGGGWCFNEGQCFSRWSGPSGSTKADPATTDMNKIGFLGNDSSTSPLFYNWNKVFLRYCDGASYAGDVTDPIINPHNSSQIMYYRGKRILNALFESLTNKYGLSNATDFVIGGGSAGGLSAFIHSNYIAKKFFDLKQTKLVSMPDVGFFIEYNGWNGKTQWAAHMQQLYTMQNISSSIIDPACFDNDVLNDSECIFPQNIAGDNEIATFVLNSQYDSFQASSILGTGTSNATLLNEYGQNFTRILITSFLNRNKQIYGAFIDGCYHHDAISPIYWTGLNIDGYSQATAFKRYYEGLGQSNNRVFWYENVTYPCTVCCPNTTDIQDEDEWYHLYDDSDY